MKETRNGPRRRHTGEGSGCAPLEDATQWCAAVGQLVVVSTVGVTASARWCAKRSLQGRLLTDAGYRMNHTDGQADFLFVWADATFTRPVQGGPE